MPGLPPRQYEHEGRYTPLTHQFILTRRILRMIMMGRMIFGDSVGLKLPEICLTGEEKHRNNLTQETYPHRDRTRARISFGRHNHSFTFTLLEWMGASMMYIVFHFRVVSEVAPALSWSVIWGGPPCPCVVKNYVCDSELIPSPDRS